MVRWQAFRRVIEQPYDFYQNDFAGRIATKIMQGGEAVGDFIVNVLQTMWSFLTFVVLAITILVSLDPLMGVVVALWFAGYAAIVWFLLPEMRSAGRATADERSIFNGQAGRRLHQHHGSQAVRQRPARTRLYPRRAGAFPWRPSNG